MSELEFDLLIVDEAQEGVDTMRPSGRSLKIQRKHTLFIPGTPFKARPASSSPKSRSSTGRIQTSRRPRKIGMGKTKIPMSSPPLSMFTYQLSGMIRERIEKRSWISPEEGTVDYMP